jgi:hypothetical protein
MNKRHQQNANKIIGGAFGLLVHAWPRSSRDWAVAMQSELPEISNPQESFRWFAGGIMSLGKAWWNQVMYGWNENEKEPSAVRTPGPVALTLAIVALAAFFLMPSVHDGFSAVLDSWPPFNSRHAADYQRIAQAAEARGDAKTLAFISSRMNLEENARLKDKAVQLDPSLTWIYFSGANSWYVYNHVPQTHGWMQKLEASDPDNAVTYLTEASIRYSELWNQFKYQNPNSYELQKGKLLNDAVWLADMEKAFAAPRYDSYYDRAMDLQQSVLSAQKMRLPQDVTRGILEYYSPGLGMAQSYSQLLISRAKEAHQKGENAAAIHDAWTVVQFTERARVDIHGDYARVMLNGMEKPACELLQPLEAAAAHTEVAKLLAVQIESFSHAPFQKNPAFIPHDYRSMDATGIALHSAGAGVILFGGAAVLSVLFLLVARLAPALRKRAAYRWACNCGRFAPAGFAAAIALMAATFAPYLEHLHDYLAGFRNPATLQALTDMEGSLYQAPWKVLRAVGNGVLWEGVIPLAVVVGILFLSRKELFRRASRTTTA